VPDSVVSCYSIVLDINGDLSALDPNLGLLESDMTSTEEEFIISKMANNYRHVRIELATLVSRLSIFLW
jgi:hypothetical protein